MTSSGGHLAPVDLSMHFSSVNTFQNQVKLCIFKVYDDMYLALANFYLSIQDCGSQASFNDYAIKPLGPKILAQGPKFLDCHDKPCFAF